MRPPPPPWFVSTLVALLVDALPGNSWPRPGRQPERGALDELLDALVGRLFLALGPRFADVLEPVVRELEQLRATVKHLDSANADRQHQIAELERGVEDLFRARGCADKDSLGVGDRVRVRVPGTVGAALATIVQIDRSAEGFDPVGAFYVVVFDGEAEPSRGRRFRRSQLEPPFGPRCAAECGCKGTHHEGCTCGLCRPEKFDEVRG